MQRTKRFIQLVCSFVFVMTGFVPQAEAHTVAIAAQSAPRQEDGESSSPSTTSLKPMCLITKAVRPMAIG